jgi:hypothetical protein
VDWLNENALRDYPFVVGTAMTPYPRAIVDASFVLGENMPFDFDEDTAELVLSSVALVPGGHVLVFEYRENGAPQGTPLTFTVPPGSPEHTIVKASSGASHGYLTIGEISSLPAGTYGAAVELRTITAYGNNQSPVVRVYNAQRRESYVPYAPEGSGLTPEQLYVKAKAAAPAWKENVCLAQPAGVLKGTVRFVAGFNVDVAGRSSGVVAWSMNTGKTGSGCAVRGYIKNKVGTSDPVADLNGDGVVTEDDVLLADGLPVAPVEITTQGTLRTFNGAGIKRGNLVLTAGRGVDIKTSQDENAVTVEVKSPALPTQCTAVESGYTKTWDPKIHTPEDHPRAQ